MKLTNGTAWQDTTGHPLHAHGGWILFHNGTYYWYGEDRTDQNYISCYTSSDLSSWTFSNHILTTSSRTEGIRIRTNLQLSLPDGRKINLERPKVLYNAYTRKYVLWAHYENGTDYSEAAAAVASCDTPDGNFTYHGSFRPYGFLSRDCTVFQDDDGSAYFISTSRDNADIHIYRLQEDYLNVSGLVNRLWSGEYREAPALFKKDSVYYMITSHCTGWKPNQAKYSRSIALDGTWSILKDIGNETTFDSQPAFVLPLFDGKITNFLYVGDRWNENDYFQSSYLFLPLEWNEEGNPELHWYPNLEILEEPNLITAISEDGINRVSIKTAISYGASEDSFNKMFDLNLITDALEKYADSDSRMRGIAHQNPVISGLYADPDYVFFNDTYYIYPTTDGFDGWSGTQFYVFCSNDGIHFSKGPLILDVSTDQVPWAVGYAWAPCIAQKNGQYYFYFCAKNRDGVSCIGVAVANHPEGPFHAEKEPLITMELAKENNISLGQAIDPSIYQEGNSYYLVFGNSFPAIVKLSDDMLHVVPETMANIEGAFDFRESLIIIKRNGMYHFTWSCDDTGSENYHVNYGTSPSLYGPIDYHYTILEKDPDRNILGTGHHSILKLPYEDSYRIAYHRFGTPLENYPEGKGFHRETCIAPLFFGVDGFIRKVEMPD